jgi:aryl-alcohol dehydrogenase-like predicted oxidoreductase
MEDRFLGRTGLRVSALSLGTMTFGDAPSDRYAVGQLGVAAARELVAVTLDAGVNLIDTADVCSGGRSEEVLGAALGSRRDEVLIAATLNGRTGPSVNDVGGSRHHIVRACEASLARCGTDYIDLYQVHGFDLAPTWRRR